MNNGRQTEDRQVPFGLAGLAGLACMAVIYSLTEPLLTRLVGSGGRLLVYLLVPLSVIYLILYRSSWRQELPKARRILSLMVYSGMVYGTIFVFVGLVLGIGILFTSGPPVASK